MNSYIFFLAVTYCKSFEMFCESQKGDILLWYRNFLTVLVRRHLLPAFSEFLFIIMIYWWLSLSYEVERFAQMEYIVGAFLRCYDHLSHLKYFKVSFEPDKKKAFNTIILIFDQYFNWFTQFK